MSDDIERVTIGPGHEVVVIWDADEHYLTVDITRPDGKPAFEICVFTPVEAQAVLKALMNIIG